MVCLSILLLCVPVSVPAGHNMMLFHVPTNVSAYIKCGSKSDCREETGSFAAWYSCPVCAYRICAPCAEVSYPDFPNPNLKTVENLLSKQFRKVGKDIKEKEKGKDEEGSWTH